MKPGLRIGLLALVAGLCVSALLHGLGSRPPVYDGIVVPPAPYRYQSPPPNLRNGNQPPLGGDTTLPVQNGQVPGGGVQTGDNQVVIFFGPGTFKAASGTTSVRCTIDPVANPPAAPSGVEIRGNVYAIKCIGQPGNSAVSASTTYHLTLRIPPGNVNDIRYYDGQTWHNLNTLFAPGGDPYASVNAPGFGDYAAMLRNGAPSSAPGPLSSLSKYLEFYGIIAFVLIFGIIAIVQEVRRRRQRSRKKVRRR
jgi:hypothetical protein